MTSPPTSSSRPQIQAHIERRLGPITRTFRDSGIDILCVDAAYDRPVHMLITAGMSDTAMNVADGNAPSHIELMITLPEQWKLEGVQPTDPGYWPIRLLAELATMPQQTGRALRWGDTVPNGDPPSPYARDTKLCGVIIAPSLLVPKEFYALDSGTRHIEFYAAIPLYREELDARAEHGMEFLLTRLLEQQANDLVDLKRRNVMKKRFGLF